MNEEIENNLPELEQGEQVPSFLSKYEWFGVNPDEYQLDFAKAYQPPKYTLSWKGTGFAPLGGIHAITGQAGHGKTTTIAQFIAAIIGGEYGNLRYELEDEIPRPKVLYIDTEMEEANTVAMKNRVLTMVQRPISEQQDDFIVYMLREVQSDDKKTNIAVMRWRMVLKAIWEHREDVTVVFLDGLLDVIQDFNSNTECQEIIYACMQTATKYNISLWCLVHQNPGSEKLVGHAGSMLERKATDIFVTKKEKNISTGLATFTVSQLKARGRDIPDWKFEVAPITGWGIPQQINVEPMQNDDPETIREWLTQGQFDIEWPATLTEIRNLLKMRGNITNQNRQQADVMVAKNRRFIIPQPDDERVKGQKHAKFYLNDYEITTLTPQDDAPF